MTHRWLPLVVVPLLTAAAAAAPGEPPPRRWTYRAVPKDDSGNDKKAYDLVLVETGRRTLAGMQVVDLAVEVGGKRVTGDDLGELGLASAPFTTFAPRWSLLFGKAKVVELVGGDDAVEEKTLKEARKEGTSWRAKDLGRKKPSNDPEDRAYGYGRKTGTWQSICQAYLHPSPETGDTFEWERCFAPGVGITVLAFDSVWGSFTLELKSAPAAPELP